MAFPNDKETWDQRSTDDLIPATDKNEWVIFLEALQDLLGYGANWVTFDTDVKLKDDKKIYFDTAKTKSLEYDSAQTYLKMLASLFIENTGKIYFGQNANFVEGLGNNVNIQAQAVAGSEIVFVTWDTGVVKTTQDFKVGRELELKVVAQASEPTLNRDNGMLIWKDTDDSNRIYLIFRRGSGDQVKVELT